MPIQRVTSRIIQDGAIVATDVADGSITGPKLGATAINANNIVDGAITIGKLAAGTLDSANSAAVYANGAFAAANAGFGVANTATTNITILQGVNTSQNTSISTASATATAAGVYANGAFAAANTKQATLVSGTNIKTVNSTSLLGSGDVAVQATLVSGTNIKTINNTSLLGSGNITAGGAWNLVGSGSFSGASTVELTNSFTTYGSYCILLDNIMGNNSSAGLYMGISTTGYGYLSDIKAFTFKTNSDSTIQAWSSNYGYDGKIIDGLKRYSDETNGVGFKVVIWLLNTTGTDRKKGAMGNYGGNGPSGDTVGNFSIWGGDTTGTVNAVRFTANAGQYTLYGTYKVYGIQTS